DRRPLSCRGVLPFKVRLSPGIYTLSLLDALPISAIDGIIEEAEEVAGEVADKTVLDAALINAGQAAEHYEITRYGSLIAWAKQRSEEHTSELQSHLNLVCRLLLAKKQLNLDATAE